MKLTKQNIEESVKKLQEKTNDSLTELLVKYSPEIGTPQEIKEALLEVTDTSYEQKRIASAMESIGDYLHRHSFPVEIKEISDNWVEAFENFSNLMAEKTEIADKKEIKTEDLLTPLQNVIGLSPKTYEIFYNAGKDLYIHKYYEKAADVFFVLLMLNHSYSNVWISLGLSEQQCGRFDQALRAFAMGAATYIESPEAFFCAANCCIDMNDYNEAKIYLEEGLERLNQDKKFEVYRGIANQINRKLSK